MAAMAWLEGETVEYYSPTQEGWVLAAVWEVVPRGYVLHFPRSDDRVFRTLARALGVGEEYRFCVAAQRQFYEMEKPAAVRLAKQRDYPLLSNLEGCIVLSTQGDRSEHDKMYGSDYDGDKAIIITNLACVPSQPTGYMPCFVANLFDVTNPDPLFKTRDLNRRCWIPRLNLFDVDEFHKVFLCHPDDTDEHINNMLVSQDVTQQRLQFLNNFQAILSFHADRKGGDCRGGL